MEALTSTQLLARVNRVMRNSVLPARWSTAEITQSINNCIDEWARHVRLKRYYTPTYDPSTQGGWYVTLTLPRYLTGPLRPEYSVAQGDEEVWFPAGLYETRKLGDGTVQLQMEGEYLANGIRIEWWARNGQLPYSAVVVATGADVGVSDVDVIVSPTAEDLDEIGLVQIGGEWMSYAGTQQSGSNIKLLNVERGLYNTAAATHSAGATVTWGVGADTDSLWRQMMDAVRAGLHEYYLVHAAPTEKQHHERQVTFYRNRADGFWQTYKPAVQPKLRLNPLHTGVSVGVALRRIYGGYYG